MVARRATRHVVFVLAALALLMGSIDSTIVAVAVPNLGSALQAPLTWVGWTLTAYLLVQIIMLPVAGKLSDTFGRKPVFLCCVGAFTLGSLLCGLAPSVGWLIIFRAVQAIGGGGLTPSAIGIVADLYPSRRAQAVGLFTSVGPIGAIVGPNLGGYILGHWGWRELFVINVPFGVLVVIGMLVLLSHQPAPARRALVDPIGLAMYAGAVALLMTGMSLAGEDPALGHAAWVWVCFAASIGLGVLFVRHIRRTSTPVVDPTLLLCRPFVVANLYSLAFGACTFGFFSFIPLYAVTRYGLTMFESGAVLTPRALAMVATSAVASLVIARTGYRKPMLAGMGLIVLTLLLLSRGWTSIQLAGATLGGFWLMALIILLSGVGIGLASPASNNAALDLAPRRVAAITGIRSMFSMTGGALSVTAMVVVLASSSDVAASLELVFEVLAGVMLAAVLLAMHIPDRSASPQPSTASHALRPIRIVARPRVLHLAPAA